MNRRTKRAVSLLRAILTEARAEGVTFLAASIAYHAFVSLLPLLLLLLLVLSAVGSRTIEEGILSLTEAALTPGASSVLLSELESAGQSTGLSIIGLVVLLWGTLRIFRGLDTAFSTIYETRSRNSFLDQVTDGVLVLGTVAGAIVVAAAITSAVPRIATGALGWWLGRATLVSGLALALFPMYYVFPDEKGLRIREVLPGVVFAAVGLTALQSLFDLYIAFSNQSPRASTVGAILVFLTWLYFSGLVVLLGAVVNAVLSNRTRDVDVEPVFSVPESVAAASASGDLDAGLERIEELLREAGEVTVSVDGEAVDLPAPDRVSLEPGGRSTDASPRTTPAASDETDALGGASITLRWTETGSEE